MLKHVLDIVDLLDHPTVDGGDVAKFLNHLFDSSEPTVTVETVQGGKGSTDFIRVLVPGSNGKTSGGAAPTLGIIGRLGGIGARPEIVGFTSDGDGAAAALAAAAKLLSMHSRGDVLAGDVIIATHICPDAPTLPHEPVAFMDSPVDIATMNIHEVSSEMDAVLSIDTTKGNDVINHRGVALSPTVKEGYVLRVSDSLVRLLGVVSGAPVVTYPVTTQDITPYGNGAYHINSILQPATATDAPVVGLAITSASVVPGCATGASHEPDIATAARFAVETAKEFGTGKLTFHDDDEFQNLLFRYGSMKQLQTLGQTGA